MTDSTQRSRSFARRRFLRGAGVTMALPWLESVPVWGASSANVAPGATAAGPFPKRFGVLFMGNGINANHFWAKGAGANLKLGKSLQPLEPLKTQLNYIGGLFNKPATGVGIHPGQTGGILSGVPLQKGAVVRGGITVDQVIANHIGQDTVQPSMVLACEQPLTGYHESNFSMAYSSHISWQSPESPVPTEVYPSLAFDSLFENRGSQRAESILNRVRDQAKSLARTVSAADQAKLDEYLGSVREIEIRLERMRTGGSGKTGDAVSKSVPAAAMKRPPDGLPEDLREHMRLMCDIAALGFQTDKTRVVSILLCRDLSGLFYPFLDVRDAHHPASHNDLSDDYERITRYYVSQLAYLAGRLAAMPEGDGTVLDNACLIFLSNMWSGVKHDNSKLPLLTVGNLGGTLKTGRVLDYLDRGEDDRKLCSLYLSLMDRMGITLDHFGNADARLVGL